MSTAGSRPTIDGPAGALEIQRDAPEPGLAVRGLAVICHPHPLHGGTLDNKVVQTVARAFVLEGWRTVRFNFRGVGASAGQWDEGRGEIDDALAVVQAEHQAGEPLALAGFSFGGFVASQAATRLSGVQPLVLVGPSAERQTLAAVAPDHTLVVHGEADDVVPLEAVMRWANTQVQPVIVMPGVGHFFHGQLPRLRELVRAFLRGQNPA